MNRANKLTMFRGVLGIIIAIFIYYQEAYAYFVAFVFFTFAVWTDYYDGILARKIGKETTFGKFMDPISDKILVIAPLVAFVDIGLIPAWMVFIIFMREIMMMAMRSLAAAKGKILGANKFGKSKGVVQYGLLIIILGLMTLNALGIIVPFLSQIIYWLILVTVVMTVVTGVMVFFKNKDLFGDA